MLISYFQDNFSSHKNQKGSETKFESKQINLGKVGAKHSSITMHDMEIADLFQIQGNYSNSTTKISPDVAKMER